MRYGLFSDVHGNLPAFTSVIRAFDQEKIDQYVCGGDVVGYGANPQECIRALKDLSAVCIAGNHDWAVLGKIDTTNFNPMARVAVDWTKINIKPEDQNFLEELNLIYKNDDFVLVHGTLQEPGHFHYLLSESEARETFSLMDRAVCFVGHTHMAGVFIEKDDRIQNFQSVNLEVQKDCRYIVNLGSVGQPRDGDWRASYCLLDTETKTISLKRVEYDVTEAQKRIRQAGLPDFLASRLTFGQ